MLTDSALAVRIDHKDFLHFPVVEVVQVSHGCLGPLYQVDQDVRRALPREERVLQQLRRRGAVSGVLLKARLHEETEPVRPFRGLAISTTV